MSLNYYWLVHDKSFELALSAISLIAALAWKDMLDDIVEQLYPYGRNTITGKFIYAFIITIVSVLILNIFQDGFLNLQSDRLKNII